MIRAAHQLVAARARVPDTLSAPRHRAGAVSREDHRKLRRSVAISAIATVIATGAVSTAPAAFAATATPAPAAAPMDDQPNPIPPGPLDVTFTGTPTKIVAGGDAAQFKLVINNKSKNMVVLNPSIALGDDAEATFSSKEATVSYEYTANGPWQQAVAITDNGHTFFSLGDMANENSWTPLGDGQSLTISVQIKVNKTIKPGDGGVLAIVSSFSSPDQTDPDISGNAFDAEYVAAASTPTGGGTPNASNLRGLTVRGGHGLGASRVLL